MKGDVTYLGLVKRVIGAKILVELSSEVPSSNPIINGRVHRLGQMGSFVRIPLGFLNLYGLVSMVGASDIGIDEDDFSECLTSGKYDAAIKADLSQGQSAGVSGTPTFFVNGVKLVGAQPYSAFVSAIDAALKE